jgi:DNA gyrase/topoisomerase IV subunit A
MDNDVIQQEGTLLSQCEEMYSEYGRYINKWRAFPLIEDGLKLVERRVLFSEYLTARKKFTKSAEVVGYCMGKLHPHGDSSIYGSLVQLCNCGLSDYNGNFGTDIGLHEEPPAAMRYTEVKMNEDVVNMAFKHLDFVPFESLELPMKEPVYLATKLPFCLIRGKRYTVGIGFGFDTYIPSYSKEDLVKRLKWLLTKEGDEPIIKPVTDCDLDNTDEQYKKLLTEPGPQSLKYKGIAIIDKNDKSIIVKSICPTKKWTTVLNAFKDEIQVQKSIGYIDESCGTETNVRFKILKRGQDINKIYQKICNLITGEVKFRCNMCDIEGNIQMYSVDQMLLRTYQRYKEANIKFLEFNIQKCQQIIDELVIVEKVKSVLPECLKKYPDDVDKLIMEVKCLTSVEIDILKNLFEKYTIPRFTRCKTDTTEKQNIKKELENNLLNINQFIWRLYE